MGDVIIKIRKIHGTTVNLRQDREQREHKADKYSYRFGMEQVNVTTIDEIEMYKLLILWRKKKTTKKPKKYVCVMFTKYNALKILI